MDFVVGFPLTSQRHNAILVVFDKLTNIISDRDSRFTSRFWTILQSAFGTQLSLSTAYHPEIDGQDERVNKVMEDMLGMYVVDYQTQW